MKITLIRGWVGGHRNNHESWTMEVDGKPWTHAEKGWWGAYEKGDLLKALFEELGHTVEEKSARELEKERGQ